MGQNAFGPSDSANTLAKTPGIAVAGISGTGSALNITAATTIKAAPGRAIRVCVIIAGTAPGAVYDCASVAATATANQLLSIPSTVGQIPLEWPCLVGITVVPGTGQTLAISFS